ncbi:hypothetical protein LZ198_39480 [Myxococcus sp. K15C18031901]|uniref:hypothetical protein n=1 Tax=Myxococcus dinghuensis TaxID=2906761 RepID=UPI0020A826AF|nr:hypothetical protein [Myxococcus dinghuensis]MCP3104965.1 hypothetical protein [Myxococcus dinghuensis]
MPTVPRLHLFEFIDQAWFPRALRDLTTDYLHTVSNRLGLFDGATAVLARGLRSGHTRELLDLGSGGRGPLPRLRRLLAEQEDLEARVLLSDKYPNAEAAARASAEDVTYVDRSVDALRVPADLRGMRTLFNTLHHFRPEEVRAVLSDAMARGVPIAAFESVRRSPAGLFSMLWVPLLVWLFTPWVRPLTPLRLVLTYVIPVAPLLIAWDGAVSALRIHSPEELRELTATLPSPDYVWEVGEVKAPGKPPVSYVLGLPTRAA